MGNNNGIGGNFFGSINGAITGWVNTVQNATKSAVDNVSNYLGISNPDILDNFEAAVGIKQQPAEPPLNRNDRGDNSYGAAPDVPLFVGAPDPNDISQGGGSDGDCYFLSAMASLAAQHPEAIQNAIKDNKDGTYTVTFHTPVGFGAFVAGGSVGLSNETWWRQHMSAVVPMEETKITVDSKLPQTSGGDLIYTTVNGQNSTLWPAIFEKAFAKLWGGYNIITNGAATDIALQALTGGAIQSVQVNPSTKDQPDTSEPSTDQQTALFNQLKDALAAGKVLTAGTFKSYDPAIPGVVAEHSYSLLGVDQENGTLNVVLRNPWGNDGDVPDTENLKNGWVRLPIDVFMKSFGNVWISTVPGAPGHPTGAPASPQGRNGTTSTPTNSGTSPTPPPPDTLAQPGNAPPPPNPNPPAPAPAGPVDYIVKSGDSLWAIATSHGITLAQIEAANPQIPNFNLIYPGQTVHLPQPAAPAGSSAGGGADPSTSPPPADNTPSGGDSQGSGTGGLQP